MRNRFLILVLLCGALSASAQSLRVVSYNVENLFHPEQDSIHPDTEWTQDGKRRWTFARYFRKEENIARVLTTIGEWDGVDVVGLQEVENEAVVKRLCYTLRPGEYGWVHYDSPDKRGIDVALIYKKARIDTLRTQAIRVDLGSETTRDILYADWTRYICSSAICRVSWAERPRVPGKEKRPNRCCNIPWIPC